MGRPGSWFKLQLNYSLNREVMAAHRLHGSAQTKQIKDKRRTCLQFEAAARPEESSSMWTAVWTQSECRQLSQAWSSHKLWNFKTDPRCTRTSIYMILEGWCCNVLHSMVGKSLIGWDFAAWQEGGIWFSRSDYLNDTHSEYSYFINRHCFPLKSEGSQLMQFTRKEAILLLHDTLPKAIKASMLY